MTPAQRTLTLWRADVSRWHSSPDRALRMSGDTTQAHSARMCLLLLDMHPNPTLDLVRAILHHDTPETVTGDIPYGAKQRWPELKDALDWAEAEVATDLDLGYSNDPFIKLADRLDAYLWAHQVAPYVLATMEWRVCHAWIIAEGWRLGIGAQIEGIMQEVD
jgi:hypothetical protein